MNAQLRKTRAVYYLVNSLYWFSIALPLALTVLFKMNRGLDLFQISLCTGLYSLTILVLVLPAGGLADSVGRKRVSIAAYSLMAVASFSLLFAFSFPAFLFVMFLVGVGRSFSPAPMDAWFIDELKRIDPSVNLQKEIANANTLVWLSLGVGLMVGSMIPDLFITLPSDGTHIFEPLSMPLVFTGAIQLILVFITILFVKDPRQSKTRISWREEAHAVPLMIKEGLQIVKGNSIIPFLMGGSAAAYLAMTVLETFWQPFFKVLPGNLNESSLFFGIVMGGSFLAGMLGNLASSPINRLAKQRYGLVCAIFLALEGLFLLLLAFQGSIVSATLFFWLVYISLSIVHSPHMAMMNREIPAEKRSTVLSLETLIGQIGGILGSVVLGYAAENLSIQIAWVIAALILIVAVWFYIMADRKDVTDRKSLENKMEQDYA